MTIIQGDELRTRGVTDLRTALSLTAPAWRRRPEAILAQPARKN